MDKIKKIKRAINVSGQKFMTKRVRYVNMA